MELFKLLGTIAIENSDANEQISETTKKASNFGESLKSGMKTVAKWGAAVVGGATAASGAMFKFASSSASTADNIDKMSQKIGISRQAYQELNFICSQSGTSVDTLQMGMKTLTSVMDTTAAGTSKTETALEQLGVSATDASGKLRGQEEVMWEVMSKLQGMENQTEKARLATELFGRSGSELMPLLNGASGSIEEMKNQAHELGLIISDETVDSGVKMTDTIDQMKRSFSAASTNLGGKFMPIVQKLARYTINNMPKIQKLFDKLGNSLSNAIDEFSPVLEWLVEDALPGLVNILCFAIDNFEKIAGVILTVVGVMKAMSIISTITTSVKSASSAFAAFNAVLSANPIGAVITSVALLATGVGLLVTSLQDEETETEKAIKRNEKMAETYKEEAQAIDDAREAVYKKSEQELTEVANVESLWKELQTLCDETGKVSDADKDRANFILNELNEALGTEYTMTGNQIQNYKDLQSEIDKTILKKRAEIELSAAEEQYTVAIQNRQSKEEELNKLLDERAEKQKVCNEYTAQAEEMLKQYQNGDITYKAWKDFCDGANAATVELKGMDESIASVTADLKSYYTDIATYENAQTAMLAGKTDEAIKILESRNDAYLKATDIVGKATEEQMKVFEQQVIDAGVKMGMMQDMLDNCAEDEKATYEKLYKEAADNFEEMKKQYVKVGGDAAKDFQTEINFKLRGFTKEMQDIGALLTNNVADGMTNNQGALSNSLKKNGKFIGNQLANGMTEGVNEGQEFFKKALGNLITGGVSFVKSIAKIHSPSRLFADEIGAYIPSGIGMGVEDNEEDALSPMKNMINHMTLPVAKASNYANINPQINNSSVNNNKNIEAKLDQLINAISNLKIYLNGETLVGTLTPAIDAQLGQIYVGKERGR